MLSGSDLRLLFPLEEEDDENEVLLHGEEQREAEGELSNDMVEQPLVAGEEEMKAEGDTVVLHNVGQIPIRVRERRSLGLSFQVWPAAYALCSYLQRIIGTSSNTGHSLHLSTASSVGKLRVLELGAGTGMVGIMCAVLGAECTITDLPHVTPNLEFNAALNTEAIERSGQEGSVVIKELRWGEQADMEAVGRSFDLVVASDVVYFDDLFEPLLRTLKWLLLGPPCHDVRRSNLACGAAGTDDDLALAEADAPVVLLAHLRRWRKDSHFFRKAAKFFHVSVVHKHSLDANVRTGVTVYSISKKRS